MAQARQQGRQVASSPEVQALVEGARPPVVLVAFPLNRPKGPRGKGSPEGPEGFVLGILQLDGVIEHAIGSHAPIQAAIGYGNPANPAVFLAGQQQKTTSLVQWFGDAEFHQKVAFAVAGQPFFLVLRSAHHGNELTRLYAPMGAGLLVLALTAMLAQSMITTILRKRGVERAVIERTAELRALNRTLSEEVEQRRQAEAALWVAKDKAESANRAKSAFLSTMSHELRTPLNAIIGFSSLLTQPGHALDAKTADYVEEINRSGVRLLDLINDILEITQMDTEDGAGNELVPVSDIIESAIAKTQPQADSAGVSLERQVGDGLPALHGDYRRLQRALSNLLSNAVKFNRAGGWAHIAAFADQGNVTIEVSDNGLGMPPGMEAVVTDIFSQYDMSLARRHEGVGLGLTFVYRVAHYHDASLAISSKLGEGTTVTLTFPARRVARALEVA